MGQQRVEAIKTWLQSKPSEAELHKAEKYFSSISWSLASVQDDMDQLCDEGFMQRVYTHEFIWHYKFERK